MWACVQVRVVLEHFQMGKKTYEGSGHKSYETSAIYSYDIIVVPMRFTSQSSSHYWGGEV